MHDSKYNQFINNLIFVIRTYAICIAINVDSKQTVLTLILSTTERKERMKKRGIDKRVLEMAKNKASSSSSNKYESRSQV